jgi:hypothetical protein
MQYNQAVAIQSLEITIFQSIVTSDNTRSKRDLFQVLDGWGNKERWLARKVIRWLLDCRSSWRAGLTSLVSQLTLPFNVVEGIQRTDCKRETEAFSPAFPGMVFVCN